MITAWYEKPRNRGRAYAPLMVSVNLYTAEAVASRFWGRTAATWICDLHITASWIVRLEQRWHLGLLLIVSTITGLYLWWPGFSRLRKVRDQAQCRSGALCFRPAPDAWSLQRRHPAIVGVHRFHLAYPKLLERYSVPDMGHGDGGPEISVQARPTAARQSIGSGPARPRTVPERRAERITTPDGENGTYRINCAARRTEYQTPSTLVWVDRWADRFAKYAIPINSPTVKLYHLIWPSHTGEAGPIGRFAWFRVGLMPPYFT